jgi:O-antigen/teichoic acid export membrane protein
VSRFKRFTHSLFSGYILLGVNILYTFASVPLALHYLSKQEIGLWGVVTQIVGYLVLVDLGMASSISRILIDHKDRPNDGVYGAIIKTGALVLLVQGAIIAIAGLVVSFWLAGLFHVPAEHRHQFQVLVAGHCLVLGSVFVGRMFNHLLLAHQRYDASNYAQIGALVINFAALWLCFHGSLGLYSLLVAYAANVFFSTIFSLGAVIGLKLLPPAGAGGRANLKTFHELFAYGREVFLLSVGWQLVNASQLLVIGRTVGFEAAGIWSIATKPFTMAQQVVYRLLDFSGAGLAEMIVRREQERLRARVRDVVIVSASFAVWVGLTVALCNHDFLVLWTQNRVSWKISSDWLMGLMVIAYATTRCYIGFIGLTKDIRAMKYMYPLEGVVFIGLSVWATRSWGMNGIIASAVVTNLLCSGWYGFVRTKEYFGISRSRQLLAWMRWPLGCLLSMAAIFAALGWADAGLDPVRRLSLNATVAVLVGFGLFWQLGLTQQLRLEAVALLGKLRDRIKPATTDESPG